MALALAGPPKLEGKQAPASDLEQEVTELRQLGHGVHV